jgi:hypothetical protein
MTITWILNRLLNNVTVLVVKILKSVLTFCVQARIV